MSWFDRLAYKLLAIAGIDEELIDPVRAGLRSVPDYRPPPDPSDTDPERIAGLDRLLADYRPFTTEFDLECETADMAAHLARQNAEPDVEALWASTGFNATMLESWLDGWGSRPGWQDMSVTLLIDHSGSMRNGGIVRALAAARVFGAVLPRVAATSEILGFTTRSWKGGQSRQRWLAEGQRPHPGRLCDLLHLVYRPQDGAAVDDQLRLMLSLDILRENVDGEAVQWALKRLLARPETRKVLVVISDGAPLDDSTSAANGGWLLPTHLAAVLSSNRRSGAIRVEAIDVGPSLVASYPNARKVDSPEKAQLAMLELLADLAA